MQRPSYEELWVENAVWLKKHRDLVRTHASPIILQSAPKWGAPHIIAALAEPAQPLIWLELEVRDAYDPIAQGNKLAEAVKRALAGPLFGYAMPYRYGLAVLRTHMELLGPFTFALSNAEHGVELAQDLLALHYGENRVVLHFSQLPEAFALPEGGLLLDQNHLALTQEEALRLADARLPKAKTTELWRASHGAYETFLVTLHEELDLPISRPGPEGPRLPVGYEVEAEPRILLRALMKRRRWLEALEITAHKLPQHVPEVIVEAGHVYHERGLHQRLWQLLSHLPPDIQAQEPVLYWRLSCAVRLDLSESMRAEVEAHLEAFEAAELRALYAGTLAPPDTRLHQAERAHRASQNALTLYQYGGMLELIDPTRGAGVLRHSVQKAEVEGRAYAVARNAGALSACLIGLGRYPEARYWGAWGLEQFGRAGLSDWQRRLLLLNDWAYACILLGETAGLEDMLLEGERQLEEAFYGLSRFFRSTLGDYLLAANRPLEALERYRTNWQQASRCMLAGEACEMVRALLDVNEPEEALTLAEQAYHLTQGEHWTYRRAATLAYGMALAFHNPKAAIAPLETALQHHKEPLLAYRLAQAGLYLSRAKLSLGDASGAKAALEDVRVGLEELHPTGLRLLSGPEDAFREVWALWQGQEAVLRLRFLGQMEVWLEDKPLLLPPRWCEILAILALQRKGLTGEQLLLQLYGDRGEMSNLKAILSKLRHIVPIANKPYRIAVSYRADFLELKELLREKRVREALSLYQGSLLPKSTAPGVEQAREALEEALRQAVLGLGDPTSLFTMAELLGEEDLEIWEAALDVIPKEDPRYPLARARVVRLQREWN